MSDQPIVTGEEKVGAQPAAPVIPPPEIALPQEVAKIPEGFRAFTPEEAATWATFELRMALLDERRRRIGAEQRALAAEADATRNETVGLTMAIRTFSLTQFGELGPADMVIEKATGKPFVRIPVPAEKPAEAPAAPPETPAAEKKAG
jgi:hypothetical protein